MLDGQIDQVHMVCLSDAALRADAFSVRERIDVAVMDAGRCTVGCVEPQSEVMPQDGRQLVAEPGFPRYRIDRQPPDSDHVDLRLRRYVVDVAPHPSREAVSGIGQRAGN